MKVKGKSCVFVVLAVSAGLVVFNCLKGVAGNLEPDGAPGPTMVTLGQLSEQIQGLSSPVNRVVRGVVTIARDAMVATASLPSQVNPDKCVVLLSDSVTTEQRVVTYPDWVARTGAAMVSLTANDITVRVEPLSAQMVVSYQIIEYK